MKKTLLKKFKKGAASFYMVAFSTLILIIIVTSFAAVIISEVTRTANDDLSQSAYDSALAGVEDAKIVAYNYQKCVNGESTDSDVWCSNIVEAVRAENAECDMVGKILGRYDDDSDVSKGVLIRESSVSNNMAQAYTCVKVTLPSNYVASVDSSRPKVIKTKFEHGVAEKVKWVTIRWFLNDQDANLNYKNFNDEGNVVFTNSSQTALPPTISISMLQTAGNFGLDDFAKVDGDKTNRGTLYLVPTDSDDVAASSNDTHAAGYIDGINKIDKTGFVKSNDGTAKNLPYAVLCQEEGDYACEVKIEIPEPIGEGTRNPDTFVFVVMLPNGSPATEFSLDFECDDICSHHTIVSEDGSEELIETNKAELDGVQIKIDSTGRANDMHRRVEVRLENESDGLLSLRGPLELLGNGQNDILLKKDLEVTSEWNY